jgi:hypothetical protein
MKTVKYDVAFEEKAGRLELIIRWFWSIPSFIVMVILSIIASIAMFVQFFHILLLGKRHRMLHDLILMYMVYYAKWHTYCSMLTDERNPIMPEK